MGHGTALRCQENQGHLTQTAPTSLQELSAVGPCRFPNVPDGRVLPTSRSSDSHKHQEPLYSAWCETRTLWSLPLLNLLAHLCNGGTSKRSLLLRPQDSRGDAGRPASLSCMQQALSARGRLLTPPACQRCARRAVRAAPVGSAWAGAGQGHVALALEIHRLPDSVPTWAERVGTAWPVSQQ